MNDRLRSLFDADQQDHSPDSALPDLAGRDRERLEQVREMFRLFAVFDAEDLYRAAVIYSRGTGLREQATARLLARRSAEAGCAPARALLARLNSAVPDPDGRAASKRP